MFDRGTVVPVALVALPHPGEEEHRVVDREAEGDAEDRRRADGVDVGMSAERIAVGDLADQRHHPDRGGDRADVEDDGDRGEQRRPQDQHEHQEACDHDGADDERDPGPGHLAVVVDDRGAAGQAGFAARRRA